METWRIGLWNAEFFLYQAYVLCQCRKGKLLLPQGEGWDEGIKRLRP
jgi:hypothetical protein